MRFPACSHRPSMCPRRFSSRCVSGSSTAQSAMASAALPCFLALCLGISNVMENIGVLTGFPFGHYHYTDVLGPKLFLVPLLIGPAYFGTGYLSWVLASVLLCTDQRRDRLPTFVVPVIAAFIMVGWDLCFDPAASTIAHMWIWENGGGYFGVPLTNFLGWYLTV